jgi:hypothetical protein
LPTPPRPIVYTAARPPCQMARSTSQVTLFPVSLVRGGSGPAVSGLGPGLLPLPRQPRGDDGHGRLARLGGRDDGIERSTSRTRQVNGCNHFVGHRVSSLRMAAECNTPTALFLLLTQVAIKLGRSGRRYHLRHAQRSDVPARKEEIHA